MTVFFLVATLLFCLKSYGYPIVTDVQDGTFSNVQDLAFKEQLMEMELVNFEKYPQLRPVYEKMIDLTEKLLIEKDGQRPIRLALVDDMNPDAAYFHTIKGDKVIIVNLGLLKLVDNDDQLAYVLGHELEHGLSILRNSTDSVRGKTPLLKTRFLSRVEENEVDVQSVFRRVFKNGMNPYASLDVLRKLLDAYGDTVSETHTMLSNRINTIEKGLTFMTRIMGAEINEQSSQTIVGDPLKAFFNSNEFIQLRKSAFEDMITKYQDATVIFLNTLKELEEVPIEKRKETVTQSEKLFADLIEQFSKGKEKVFRLLHGVISYDKLRDYQDRQEEMFIDAIFTGLRGRFPDGVQFQTLDQLTTIHRILRRGIIHPIKPDEVIRRRSYLESLINSNIHLFFQHLGDIDIRRHKSILKELTGKNVEDIKFQLIKRNTDRIVGILKGPVLLRRKIYLIHKELHDIFDIDEIHRRYGPKVKHDVILSMEKVLATALELNFGRDILESLIRSVHSYAEKEEKFLDDLVKKALHFLDGMWDKVNKIELGQIQERFAIELKNNNLQSAMIFLESLFGEYVDRRAPDVRQKFMNITNFILQNTPTEYAKFVRIMLEITYFDMMPDTIYTNLNRRRLLDQFFGYLEKFTNDSNFRSFANNSIELYRFYVFFSPTLKGGDIRKYTEKMIDHHHYFARYANHWIEKNHFGYDHTELKFNLLNRILKKKMEYLDSVQIKKWSLIFYGHRDYSIYIHQLALNRIKFLFNSLNNNMSTEEKFQIILKKIYDEIGFNTKIGLGFDRSGYRLIDMISHFFYVTSFQLSKAELLLYAIEPLRIIDRNAKTTSLEEELEYAFRVMKEDYHIQIERKIISIREKFNWAKVVVALGSPSVENDILFDELFEVINISDEILDFFKDEKIIGKLYYNSNKRRYAIYQLNQKYRIDNIQRALWAGRLSPPRVDQERFLVSKIKETIDLQFPEKSFVKNGILNYVENAAWISRAETRKLDSSRLRLENWHEYPDLVFFDLPDIISSTMVSPFNRKQLLEYLIGVRQDLPDFALKLEDDDLRRQFPVFKTSFVLSSVVERSMMIQPLLDRNIGILSEPDIARDIDRLILGDKYQDPAIKRLFESYLDAAPESEKKVIYSYILSSFVDAPPDTRGAPLKSILEAMGPFGIKAGQFLNTSGLLPVEYSRDLKDFLDNALPPDRSKVISDLERALGTDLASVVTIDGRLGSGSINYVQGVTMDVQGKEVAAVARIRRDNIEGIVANENDIWSRVVQDMKNSEDPREQSIADIIEETRMQSLSTLRIGGAELDLSIERDRYDDAQRSYGRTITDGVLDGWEIKAARPIMELQQLVDPSQQKFFSFYEKVEHTPLGKIRDPRLRGEIARTIVDAELTALFEDGIYDPDGHPGNWLIDVNKKQIVRIDYAQLRTISVNERAALKAVFAELVKPRPNFASDEIAKHFAALLESNLAQEELIPVIQSVSFEDQKGIRGNPHEKLFTLRRKIEEKLPNQAKRHLRLSDTLRTGLASLGKISGFAEYMPRASYLRLFTRYAEIPKHLVLAESLRDSVQGTNNRVGNFFSAKSIDDSPTVLPDNATEISTNNGEAETLLTQEDTPEKTNFRPGQYVPVDLGAQTPGTPNSVLFLTDGQYQSLPDGVELYDRFVRKHIKGVDPFQENYGVIGSDYLAGGGPKLADVTFGPPASIDLTQNAYYTDKNGLRIVLLRPDDLAMIPDGTVLFDTDGNRLIKGRGELNPKEMGEYINLGFPDANQLERYGAPISALLDLRSTAGSLDRQDCVQKATFILNPRL